MDHFFQPGSQKQQQRVIPCYEISTMAIGLVQILGPGLCCIEGACATFTAPIICETSRVVWVNVCGVTFPYGCLTGIRPTERADPGIPWRSKSNSVQRQRWGVCCGNLLSHLRVTTSCSKSATLSCPCNHTFWKRDILKETAANHSAARPSLSTKMQNVVPPISLLLWLSAQEGKGLYTCFDLQLA